LLELFADFRDGKYPDLIEISQYPANMDETDRKVFPEIPINPSGHILADKVQAYSRVSYISGWVCSIS